MATSTIKVYGTKTGNPFKLTEDKNFVIEDINTYLSTYWLKTFTDYQYQKDLGKNEIKVKIVEDQASLDKKLINCWKYVEITNSDNSSDKFYYFIKSKNWISKEAVELELSLDVLNTFNYGTDYILGEKTTVQREHKDRIDGASEHDKLVLSDVEGVLLQDEHYVVKFLQNFLTNKTYSVAGGAYLINKETGEEIEFLGYVGKIQLRYEPVGLDTFIGIRVIDQTEHEDILYASTWPDYASGATYVMIVPDFDTDTTAPEEIKSIETKTVYTRVIDEYNEGFNPVLYKTNETQVNSLSEGQDQAFYLAYYTRPVEGSEDHRMEAYLLADNEININQAAETTIRKTASEFNSIVGSFPVKGFLADANFLGWMDPKDSGGWDRAETTWPASFVGYEITIHRPGSLPDITISPSDRVQTFGIFKFSKLSVRINDVYYHQIDYTSIDFKTNISLKKCIIHFAFYGWFDSGANGAPYTIEAGNVTGKINSIANLDRTDSNIVKIVKLPYSPASFTPTKFPIGWVNGTIGKDGAEIATLQLADYIGVQAMSNDLTTNVKVIEDVEVAIPSGVQTTSRDDTYESKLYNSEFYTPKFTFDSFSYPIALENVETVTLNDALKVGFKVSSLISSDYMFSFDNLAYKRGTQDYENVLMVHRNNELPLFSDDYLNYLRNGYNYEKKSKEQKSALNFITSGLQIAGGIADVIWGTKVLGATMITSGAAQLATNIGTTIQGERDLQQKLDEKRNQAESVSSCDAVDLMSIYTNDKAKLCTYEASERVKSQLADLFYYCGYATNEQKLPDVTSRYWFNFLQCQPELETYGNLDDENVSKLSAKFNEGVTFMHKQNGTWNIEQDKENIETSIL